MVQQCLIAPCLPSQAWFPTLLELLTDHPRRLPKWDHLLWHPLGRVYHNSPSFYKLHIWKLSGAFSEQNNYLKTLSAASPLFRGEEPLTPISQSGLSTKLGVGKKVHPVFPTVPKLVDFLNYLILDIQGLQSPASRTWLSSPLELTLPILLPFARAKKWPITALDLPEVNKPRDRISGMGISIVLQYIQRPAR
jgi:hypothetical protein